MMGEPWAIDPQFVSRFALPVRRGGEAPEQFLDIPSLSERRGRVAVIAMHGILYKSAPPWMRIFGYTSQLDLAAEVRRAAGDSQIDGIVLSIDSPGGSAAGNVELADAIRTARQSKRVAAHVSGLMASAAYYCGSQAERITAGRMDLIGSIGTLNVLYDFSKMFAEAGVEPVVIKTGDFKGLGVMGTEITEQQRAYLQKIVDGFQADFLNTVQTARPAANLDQAADGRVFLAGDAIELGLIDGIGSLDEAIQWAGQRPDSPPPRKGASMSEETKATAPQPATLAELKAACQGAGSDFLMAQLEANATASQAQAAWMRQLAADRDAAQQKAEAADKARQEAETKLAEQTARPPKPGVQPLGGAKQGEEEGGGSAIQRWEDAVRQEMETTKCTRKVAAQRVAARDEPLRAAYVEEHNKTRRRA